jgi:hypothetical protein
MLIRVARSAQHTPPVISTIIMLRLFARRQRASMSAYFTNALTPPTGLGLLASLAAGLFRSGSAWLGRSQKDGLPTCREGPCGKKVQGHQLAHREGQPRRCPFLIGIGNGCQVRATLLCSLPYRSPAQASPLMDHAVFGSVFLRCSWDLQRSPRGTGADSRYAKRKSLALLVGMGLRDRMLLCATSIRIAAKTACTPDSRMTDPNSPNNQNNRNNRNSRTQNPSSSR